MQLLLAHRADQTLQVAALEAGKVGAEHIGQRDARAIAGTASAGRVRTTTSAAGATRAHAGRRRARDGRAGHGRIVQVVVDLLPQLVVLVGVGLALLHPEEELLAGALEAHHVDATGGALRDALGLDVLRKDHEVVLDETARAILPAEVHERVVRLVDVDEALALVRLHHLVLAQRHLTRLELDKMLAAASLIRRGEKCC